MEVEQQTTIATLLSLSGADAARMNLEFGKSVVEHHRRARQARCGDRPTDAEFSAQLGLKENTYAKMRLNLSRGHPTRWSRISLAAIALSDRAPLAVRLAAHQLLWLAVLRGAKPSFKEANVVLRALAAPAMFRALAEAARSDEQSAWSVRAIVERSADAQL